MNINATLLGQTLAFVLLWPYVGGMYGPQLLRLWRSEKKNSDGLEAAKKANDSLEEAKLNYEAELDKANQSQQILLRKPISALHK